MQPIEASELKVFIFALSQLEKPLPEAVQSQINAIKIPADIHKLAEISQSYSLLAASYQKTQAYLDKMTTIRTKGIDVLPASVSNSLNTEIENFSREVEAGLVEFEAKTNHHNLAEIAVQIFQSLNPVSKAKDIIKKLD